MLTPTTGAYAKLRASGVKADLALVVADEPATVAGVFTKNVMCAAPVLYCKDVLSRKTTTRAVRPSCPSCWPFPGPTLSSVKALMVAARAVMVLPSAGMHQP